MTPAQWDKICGDVADAMKVHTKPFVTPLRGSNDRGVRLVGTGSYVMVRNQRILLTCEHVKRECAVEYSFNGTDNVFRHPGPFTTDRSLDIAFGHMTDVAWEMTQHQAASIPYDRFAATHRVADRCELLFFRGYAGENAHYGFETHEASATGYCSQEKVVDTPSPRVFELFWEPGEPKFTTGTSAEAQANMKLTDPRGFSGSLVWNTRYWEVSQAGKTWTPEDAVVTGLLQRWDEDTRSLLALRVEHLRGWLNRYL